MAVTDPLTLLLGGARSGKSSLAVEIGHRHLGDVCVVATAPEVDADMGKRIERHRADRPDSWQTIEEQHDLVDAFQRADDALVIVDCLTLWTSNLMWAGRSDAEIRQRADAAARAASTRRAPVVAISNEVGMGVHPETELGRRYRDVLGWVNQRWAAEATCTLLLVAGRAVRMDDPWKLLDGSETAS